MTRGNLVLPSADTETPDVPVDGLLTPRDFGIPPKPRYYLTEIAEHMCRVEEDAAAHVRAFEAAKRTLERECERGALRGVKIGRVIVIPAAELARYFLAKNTLISDN